MKVTPETHSFCCLGVKAYLEGDFENGLDPAESLLPGFLPGPASSLAIGLNDSNGVSFEGIARVFSDLRDYGDEILAAVKAVPSPEFREWIDALNSGEFEQSTGMLAQEILKS